MQRYSSTLKSVSFLYTEMKKASILISKGHNLEEVKENAINDNIFMINSESRKRQIASTVINRMRVLDDFLIEKIVYGDLDTSKQIVFYSILKIQILFSVSF